MAAGPVRACVLRGPFPVLELLEIEDGAEGFDWSGKRWERGELDSGSLIEERDRTVGGAEVEPYGIQLTFGCLHSLHYFAV